MAGGFFPDSFGRLVRGMHFSLQADKQLSASDLARIERTTQEIGGAILAQTRVERPGMLDRRWWEDRIMSWAMQDESVKVQMFRFVDVLPMLSDGLAVARHLREYFCEVREHLPRTVRLGLDVAGSRSIAARALAIAARRNVMAQARRFIAGTTAEEVLAAAMRQRKLRRAFTLDLLGEAVTSHAEADAYLDAYVRLIQAIAPQVNAWPESPQIDRSAFACIPRVNVSVKLSALDGQFDPLDARGTTERVASRLRQLLRVAKEHGAFVNVDMESYHTKSLTLDIFKQVFMEDEFRGTGDVGIVIQAYLKDSEHDLRSLRDWAIQRGTPVWVRIVKGAYWDYETTFARATGWPVPVYERKAETDSNFERLSRYLMLNHQVLRPAIASHNVRSLAHAISTARHLGIPQSGYELQMLYGMGDEEKQALVDMGLRMRIYMPFGELIPGMAYLVRRLLENTSNDSFLKMSFTDSASTEMLLMNPDELIKVTRAPAPVEAHPWTDSLPGDFQNEPPTDFSREENHRAMQQAIDDVAKQLGRDYPLVIGNQPVKTQKWIASLNPSHRKTQIGRAAAAQRLHVEQAVAAAYNALPAWRALSASERAVPLRAAAQIMRRRRFELAAWIVHECGKGWRDADADVAEAIDFIEYYTAAAIELEERPGVSFPGEENHFGYLPRGVAGVVAPWNFPLAILTGMTTAALATGNTVVMKPAEQSPVVAAHLMQIFLEASVPSGVVNYVPGEGAVAGAALVEHPHTALVAFTGSREVGLAIHRRAAELSTSGTDVVKRVVAELGGKNAIIIDDDADLDEAVSGVVKSAFGYQGQKCSACSRVVVLEPVCQVFLDRLIEAVKSMVIGPAEDPHSRIGPVIDAESLARIESYIELGKKEGKLALGIDVGKLADEGFYVGPHLFTDVDPDSRLAQEEIFGPVLAILKAKDLDEAIRIANGTHYALTAGIYSRSPANLRRASREIMAGNLYLNRSITGALVGRQPFGGFKLSGIGSQAGGRDYLLQFVVPRTVTENTMRRGFAPPQEADREADGGT